MPTITVKKPFNYCKGLAVEHIPTGRNEVSQAVANHAFAHGFAEQPSLGAGSITATDLATGAQSGPHPVESLTMEVATHEPRRKKTS